MRDYGRVQTTFWTSETTSGLSDDGKLLALYLLTSPHTTALGCFRLPSRYVEADLGWGAERVSKGFGELFQKGFATVCQTTFWVLIPEFLHFNPPENPNQRKAILKLLAQVPDHTTVRAQLFECIARHCKQLQDVITELRGDRVNPCETVSKPLPNPLPTLSKPGTGTGTGAGAGGGRETPPPVFHVEQVTGPETSEFEPTPEDAPPLMLARGMIEQLGIPFSQSLLVQVAECITAKSKSAAISAAEAHDFIRGQALAAKGTVAKWLFWFRDAGYEPVEPVRKRTKAEQADEWLARRNAERAAGGEA